MVLVGLLAGCSSATDGDGAPNAAPSTTAQGLPVPDDRVGSTASAPDTTGQPTSAPATSAPATTVPPTTPPATTPAPTLGPTGRACPADVTRTLPGGGPATLAAGYGTPRFRLFLCRTDGGALYYRGISRTSGRATTLAARTVPGGYEARGTENGDTFVYRVTPQRLTVTQNGKPLFTDPVTSTL